MTTKVACLLQWERIAAFFGMSASMYRNYLRSFTYLLKLSIHLLYLLLHTPDFRLARFDLALQFFDFEVEHKLELFQLEERRGMGFTYSS